MTFVTWIQFFMTPAKLWAAGSRGEIRLLVWLLNSLLCERIAVLNQLWNRPSPPTPLPLWEKGEDRCHQWFRVAIGLIKINSWMEQSVVMGQKIRACPRIRYLTDFARESNGQSTPSWYSKEHHCQRTTPQILLLQLLQNQGFPSFGRARFNLNPGWTESVLLEVYEFTGKSQT